MRRFDSGSLPKARYPSWVVFELFFLFETSSVKSDRDLNRKIYKLAGHDRVVDSIATYKGWRRPSSETAVKKRGCMYQLGTNIFVRTVTVVRVCERWV